jgi:hypothetical protein
MPNELSSMLDGFAIEDSQAPHQEFIDPASTGASEVEWFSNLLERAAQYGYRAS